MDISDVSPIRPALETLRVLDQGQFLDKLSVQIHDAVSAVQVLGKPAKISITIEFAPLSKHGLVEPVITAEVDISTKLPKPDAHQTVLFIDNDGNPTTQQQRQTGLQFSVADNKGASTA